MRRPPLALLCAPALTVALAACGASSVSTSAFKGQQRQVAQAVADLQADSTAGEAKKVCANDLASAVVARLGGASHCETAIKNALNQVDNLEVSVQSVHIASASPHRKGALETASAKVRSIHSGKTRESTVSLVKEGSKWKVSGLG
jgi:hypothetical protein